MRPIRAASLLLVVVLAACTTSPGTASSPGWTTSPSLEAPSPSTVRTPPPASPTQPQPTVPAPTSPAPPPSLVPTHVLAWDPVASIGGEMRSVMSVLALEDAYLVIGSDADGLFSVARSTDGRDWSTTPISTKIEPCGWSTRSDSTVYAAATNGARVVLMGDAAAPNVGCDSQQTVSWVSDDGRSWQRGPGFVGMSGAAELWPIPGGWEALVSTRSIWRSSDGLAWRQVSVVVPSGWTDGPLAVTIGTAANGTLVMSQFNYQWGSEGTIGGLLAGESRLQSSIDGVDWTPVDLTLPSHRGVVTGGIRGPGPVGPSTWLLVTDRDEDEPVVIYASADLGQWQDGTFPRNKMSGLSFTRYGLMATGWTHCPPGSGDSCRTKPAQYLSTDGLTWTRFAESVGFADIVDGPAGVIAISQPGLRVWVLRP